MLKEVKQLDREEYKVLFDTLYTPLCLFANKYLNNMELSKDAVQEVFINVWDKRISFQDEIAIKSYLYSAVKNKSLDYLKSKHYKVKSNLTIEDIKKLETDTFFLREVVVTETSEIMDKAINTLPFKCKKIIELSLNGFSNKQIAEELSISINTIKAQKKIAYRKLRPLLKNYFFLVLFIFNP